MTKCNCNGSTEFSGECGDSKGGTKKIYIKQLGEGELEAFHIGDEIPDETISKMLEEEIDPSKRWIITDIIDPETDEKVDLEEIKSFPANLTFTVKLK